MSAQEAAVQASEFPPIPGNPNPTPVEWWRWVGECLIVNTIEVWAGRIGMETPEGALQRAFAHLRTMPEGWQLVPVAPTEAMRRAGQLAELHPSGNIRDYESPWVRIWPAMLSASAQENTVMTNDKQEAAQVPAGRNPIQPLIMVGAVQRFKANAIVRDLLDHASKHGFDMNVIAANDYSDDDRQQFAQLIGYSLSSYGDLSYVSDEAYNAAAAMWKRGKPEAEARADALRDELAEMRKAMNDLRVPIARLFGVHPDDLGELQR